MNFGKFFQYTIIVTTLALVYIHLQMQIIDMAYQGEVNERQIRDYMEKNDNAFYAISRLKSANHLGDILLAKNSDMQFAGPGDIMQVAVPADMAADNRLNASTLSKKKSNLLLSVLSLATQAEAGGPR